MIRQTLRDFAAMFRGPGVRRTVSTISRYRYDMSGNPLYAWDVYRMYRDAEDDVPEWVLEYLDRAAANLFALTHQDQINNPAAAIAEALEMKRPGKSGRGSVFSDYKHEKNLALAGAVQARVDGGEQETYAVMIVAREKGVSESTVWRSWRSFKKSATS